MADGGQGGGATSTVVDATSFSNAARFVNHSCAPNCEARLVRRRKAPSGVPAPPRVIITTLRPILPMEELTYDYFTSSGSGPSLQCRCGAVGCRGSIF